MSAATIDRRLAGERAKHQIKGRRATKPGSLLRSQIGAVIVDDGAAANAVVDLAALGVDSGPCGAASLAALRILATEPARSSLGLSRDSSVLLLNTEGSDAAG